MEREPKPLQRKYSLCKQSSFAKPVTAEKKKQKKKKVKKPPKKREAAFALDYTPKTIFQEEAEENAAENASAPEDNGPKTELPELNPGSRKSKVIYEAHSSDDMSSKNSSFRSSLDLGRRVVENGNQKPSCDYEHFERSYR